MAKEAYIGIGNIARKIKSVYIGDENGVAKSIRKGYIGDENGVAKLWFDFRKKIGEYGIGESVFLNVGGTLKEFLVVHQGIPDSTLYDSSCNGSWLLMKDLYQSHVWDEGNSNNYRYSDVSIYLNNDVFALFDVDVQSAIKTVKIPYSYCNDESQVEASVNSGSSGAEVKIFLPSTGELGYDHGSGSSLHAKDGANLDYFKDTVSGGKDAKRIAYYNGTANYWHTRTCRGYATTLTYYVDLNGQFFNSGAVSNRCTRPMLILPPETLFDRKSNLFLSNGGVKG